jgi:hypothetical protein
MPDRALLQSKQARVFLGVALIVGLAGCAVVAANGLVFFQGANVYGFWFQFTAAIVLTSLFLRPALARWSAAK